MRYSTAVNRARQAQYQRDEKWVILPNPMLRCAALVARSLVSRPKAFAMKQGDSGTSLFAELFPCLESIPTWDCKYVAQHNSLHVPWPHPIKQSSSMGPGSQAMTCLFVCLHLMMGFLDYIHQGIPAQDRPMSMVSMRKALLTPEVECHTIPHENGANALDSYGGSGDRFLSIRYSRGGMRARSSNINPPGPGCGLLLDIHVNVCRRLFVYRTPSTLMRTAQCPHLARLLARANHPYQSSSSQGGRTPFPDGPVSVRAWAGQQTMHFLGPLGVQVLFMASFTLKRVNSLQFGRLFPLPVSDLYHLLYHLGTHLWANLARAPEHPGPNQIDLTPRSCLRQLATTSPRPNILLIQKRICDTKLENLNENDCGSRLKIPYLRPKQRGCNGGRGKRGICKGVQSCQSRPTLTSHEDDDLELPVPPDSNAPGSMTIWPTFHRVDFLARSPIWSYKLVRNQIKKALYFGVAAVAELRHSFPFCATTKHAHCGQLLVLRFATWRSHIKELGRRIASHRFGALQPASCAQDEFSLRYQLISCPSSIDAAQNDRRSTTPRGAFKSSLGIYPHWMEKHISSQRHFVQRERDKCERFGDMVGKVPSVIQKASDTPTLRVGWG
ncbi:hypothetical protein ACRALDRAFT_209386 [Sodiomyces alcalophilus JCM 7366]|uniref:uncharacterized protein n=1 Tax=Sodiomyces alcalophilus JCM 7366 TaxID=591952 RepID=UPI0039B45772